MKKLALLFTLFGVATLLQGCLLLTTAGIVTDVAVETVDVATDIVF